MVPETFLKVTLPFPLQRFADRAHLEVAPGTVRDFLAQVREQEPALYARITEKNGRLAKYVKIFVDDLSIDELDGELTLFSAASNVRILVATAGG